MIQFTWWVWSLDFPWRWRGRTQHCSTLLTLSSVVGRTPPPDPLAVGDSQAAPQNGTATGLGQGGDVGEGTPCLTTLLEGHLCVTLEDGKEWTFSNVTFTRLSAPDLRTQKLGLVERNSKTSWLLLGWFISLSRALKMFHSWGVLEMELDIS